MYFTPYIDEAGLHLNTYDDILQSALDDVRSIYGDDVYIDNDSKDYQFLSVLARKQYDAEQMAQLVYNNHSPVGCVGSALDTIVKINGLKRQTPSYSTCQVTLTGTNGTVITNGVVQDINGYKWDLPSSVTIPVLGYIIVIAECETIGEINAMIGDITTIVTPTYGWLSVTNATPAVAGTAIESDSALRERQTVSVALPSQTLLEGVSAGIESVDGVTIHREYENDTNITDSDGFPAHSITCVVEGGTDEDVAQQIYLRKGVGGYTNGTTAVNIVDAFHRTTTIRFYRPTYIPIQVQVNITQLSGYTSDMAESIETLIYEFINGYGIGEDIIWSALWYEVQSIIPDLRNPPFKITSLLIGVYGGSPSLGTDDIAIDATEVAYIPESPEQIEVIVT